MSAANNQFDLVYSQLRATLFGVALMQFTPGDDDVIGTTGGNVTSFPITAGGVNLLNITTPSITAAPIIIGNDSFVTAFEDGFVGTVSPVTSISTDAGGIVVNVS